MFLCPPKDISFSPWTHTVPPPRLSPVGGSWRRGLGRLGRAFHLARPTLGFLKQKLRNISILWQKIQGWAHLFHLFLVFLSNICICQSHMTCVGWLPDQTQTHGYNQLSRTWGQIDTSWGLSVGEKMNIQPNDLHKMLAKLWSNGTVAGFDIYRICTNIFCRNMNHHVAVVDVHGGQKLELLSTAWMIWICRIYMSISSILY